MSGRAATARSPLTSPARFPTVRHWLRPQRGRHVDWLRRRGLTAAHRFDPDVVGGSAAEPTALGDAVLALAGAVLAVDQHLVRGRLLTRSPPTDRQ